jgi:hypothetical protein
VPATVDGGADWRRSTRAGGGHVAIDDDGDGVPADVSQVPARVSELLCVQTVRRRTAKAPKRRLRDFGTVDRRGSREVRSGRATLGAWRAKLADAPLDSRSVHLLMFYKRPLGRGRDCVGTVGGHISAQLLDP